jgi:hypothetical protein
VGRLEAITITLKLLRRGWWPSLLACFDAKWPMLVFALTYFCKVAARPNSENIPGCEQFCTDSP